MSKAKCIPCLGASVKDAIRDLGDIALNRELEKILDCPEPLGIELCVKPPRAKSEYQIFIKECLPSKPIKGKPFGEASRYMKECSVEWRRLKEERGNGKLP